jgi:hypothetical protein
VPGCRKHKPFNPLWSEPGGDDARREGEHGQENTEPCKTGSVAIGYVMERPARGGKLLRLLLNRLRLWPLELNRRLLASPGLTLFPTPFFRLLPLRLSLPKRNDRLWRGRGLRLALLRRLLPLRLRLLALLLRKLNEILLSEGLGSALLLCHLPLLLRLLALNFAHLFDSNLVLLLVLLTLQPLVLLDLAQLELLGWQLRPDTGRHECGQYPENRNRQVGTSEHTFLFFYR